MESVVLSNDTSDANGRKERFNAETQRARRRIETEWRGRNRETGKWARAMGRAGRVAGTRELVVAEIELEEMR